MTTLKSAIPDSFDYIRISIASPEQIRSWSFGEVTKPETINYRTFKPEKDGLFCARIFGPIKDYECLCGKYKKSKYKGIICDKCGVEITLSRERRVRMGHIELATPLAHIWFFKSLPSRLALLLDISVRDLERILYFENYIVIEPGLTELKFKQLLSTEEYFASVARYGEEAFEAKMGANAIRQILINLDLQKEFKKLQEELAETSSVLKRKKLVRTLQIFNGFINSQTRPEWMIMTVIPVLPPDLRPLVPLDGGRFATSDLNDLYRRVINRNNRLKKLMELNAPDIILRNEMRMLQEAFDALYDNTRRQRVITGANKRPLKSLSDILKGKQGRFRQNLLGKRVDYSGRSVIVVGPSLKIYQCGLPKKMAIELFKPFIYAKLEQYGIAPTIKAAKKLVDLERPEIWDILHEVVRNHVVLLNRAPTLHRLSIQAFEPILVEGKAIQLHPLVCAAFNADFDGDQMAVHVPLSLEAQLEARLLMLSSNNLVSSATGLPIMVPTKDSVLGLYYLTMICEDETKRGLYFSNLHEVRFALESKRITLHTPINAGFESVDANGTRTRSRVDTTAGRLLLFDIIPKHPRLDFSICNKQLYGKDMVVLVDAIYRTCGQKKTVKFCDEFMQLGFHYATSSGISFGKDDLLNVVGKDEVIATARNKVNKYEQQYQDGLMTRIEKYNKVIDTWSRCTDQVADMMVKQFEAENKHNPNGVYMMYVSGARGTITQLKQICGMRGLMVKANNEVIEDPITTNFKVGLTPIEYFGSIRGARKGLADTSLKTADSGYLTRRLVDVAQDCIITESNCNAQKALEVSALIEGSETIESLEERILGRVVAEPVINAAGEMLLEAGELVNEEKLHLITDHAIDRMKIRSVLTCDSKQGVCAACYGYDLARGKIVNIGEAVGIIAAQSIGEPGTQLTMRTFHIGGVAQNSSSQSFVEAICDGFVELNIKHKVQDKQGNIFSLNRKGEIVIRDEKRIKRAIFSIPYGAKLHVQDGGHVKKGHTLAEWDAYSMPIISEVAGRVNFIDIVEGLSVREILDENTGLNSMLITDWRQFSKAGEIRPRIQICDKLGNILILPNGNEVSYNLNPNAVLEVTNHQDIAVGDVIFRVLREVSKAKDITGGLPRISELLEARSPKDPSIMVAIDGIVEISKENKGRKKVIIHAKDGSKSAEYLVPKHKSLLIQDGDEVKRGELIADGSYILADLLQILGLDVLAEYIIKEIQIVYRKQGIKISDKHLEIIINQMLRKVEIVDPSDSYYIAGENIDKADVLEFNVNAANRNQRPIAYRAIINGITKASLQTKSFISAASFQETTRVLTEASVLGKKDHLLGLKENVMMGRLIPAGVGAIWNALKRAP